MENNGHIFKPGDVLAPKDWSRGNVVIVVVEASRWMNDIPVYKIFVNRETSSVYFELTDIDETWLSKHYFREGCINIANYNWDDLKDILEGILKKFPRMDYKPDAILRTWKDPEFEKYSKPKGEEKMNDGIYKVGDILEFPGGCETYRLLGFTNEETRGLILDTTCSDFGKVFYSIILREKSGGKSAIRNIEEKELWTVTKRVGHMDISALRFEKQKSPSPEFISAFSGGWILAMMNQKDKDCTDSEKFHKLMDILNRVDELQDQTEKIRNLEEENSRLKKENEELRQIDKDLADKVGELNAVIGELTREKMRLGADQGAIKDKLDCAVSETREYADKLGRLSNWLRGVQDED